MKFDQNASEVWQGLPASLIRYLMIQFWTNSVHLLCLPFTCF